MSTQQDIYAAGSENRPPMLNKENYVPWSSRLLRYAKNREVLVPETFHEQTDDELTEAEIKQMEADDQAIQTIHMLGTRMLGISKRDNQYRIVGIVVQDALGVSENKCWVELHSQTKEKGCCLSSDSVVDDAKRKKQESNSKLRQASTSGTQTDKAPVYDSDGSAECGTRGGIVDQHPATVEETRAYFESLYNNMALEVEKIDNTAKTSKPQLEQYTEDRAPLLSKSIATRNKEVE
ncbi:hypothetical protein Tco_0480626 [Tanacetum coccineum]